MNTAMSWQALPALVESECSLQDACSDALYLEKMSKARVEKLRSGRKNGGEVGAVGSAGYS